MEGFLGAPAAAGCERMGLEGSAGGSLLSVSCEGMEGVDGGLGSRVGGCGGMGMEDFSRLDVHAEMWIGWCNIGFFRRLRRTVEGWRLRTGWFFGCQMSLEDVDALWG